MKEGKKASNFKILSFLFVLILAVVLIDVYAILSYKNINFFLAGDLTCEGETEIIKQNLNLQAEIYKASHHGSRWSNCAYILDKINPEMAIIQSRIDNTFGHPHQETLDRLNNRNIEILRNDELGDIWIYSDGLKFWLP